MRTTLFGAALDRYDQYRRTLPENTYPFWASRLTGGRLPYAGLLYKPFRQFQWSTYYTFDRNMNLTPVERREQRLAELPTSKLWKQAAYDAARMHWVDCCAICNRDRLLVRDHLIPISHQVCPGTVPSNLLPLCIDCNKGKYNLDLCEYMQSRPLATTERILSALSMVWSWQKKCWERGWR